MMLHSVKIWLRVVIGFMFAVCVLVGITSFALTGTVATDSLEIIITEATGTQTEEAIIVANLQPLSIQIALYFSIGGMFLCLIFLYFLEHNFSVFVAPGVISVFSVIFFRLLLNYFTGFVPVNISAVVLSYINLTVVRANYASLFALVIGLLMVVLSYLDHKKKRRTASFTP